MIENIRKQLLSNEIIRAYTSGEGIEGAIFHEFKPKVDIDNYILLKDKPLDISHTETYQLDVYVFGKDITALLTAENAIREELNDKKGVRLTLNSETPILDMTMLTGGGRQYDKELDRFVSVQFFRITI